MYSSQLLGRWDELPQFDLHSTELRRSLPADDPAVEQTRHLCRLVFRRRGGIDRAIGHLCPRQPAPRVLRILRPALAWILFQDGLHPALAVDCAVRVANQTLDSRQAGFLNAVLRRAVEERDQLRNLAMKDLDLGSWLESRWTARFGADKTREIADLIRLPAPVTARALANSPNSAAAGLEAMPSMDWAEGERLYRVVEAQTFLRSDAARNFYFQDAATLLPIHLLDPQRGETIADLCAAPGGKAIVISERVGAKGHVIACDHSRERLFTLKDNLDGYSNVEIRQGDASKPQFDEGSLDAVLLDVPCSNTGVLRRKPDAKWNQGPGKLDELVALQGKILDGACVVVKRGGRLVYSTCSIEPEENTQQVQAFLQRNSHFELIEERQLLPCEDHDGAYAAVLRRK
jgi:16S rRNA (cytosine967-C5)-methyltransferase